jgi:hypothetical protein
MRQVRQIDAQVTVGLQTPLHWTMPGRSKSPQQHEHAPVIVQSWPCVGSQLHMAVPLAHPNWQAVVTPSAPHAYWSSVQVPIALPEQ